MRRLDVLAMAAGATLAISAAGWWMATRSGGSGRPEADLTVKGSSLTVEIAATRPTRERGLMYRTSLDEDRGMLFVYPEERILSFWMRNTTVPLSIAYLDREGTVTEIRWMRPLDLSSTVSNAKARYALEVNEGWFEKRGIEPGERVVMPDWVKGIQGEP